MLTTLELLVLGIVIFGVLAAAVYGCGRVVGD